jgi:hypothetical protein
MTVGTVQFSPKQVGLMPEFDKIRNIKNAYPGDRPALIKIFLFLKDLRVGRDDILVAEKTFFHFREAGMFRSLNKGMAKPAVDGLYAGMNPVAERNRLFRAYPPLGIDIIKKEHHPHQYNRCQEPFQPSTFFLIVPGH